MRVEVWTIHEKTSRSRRRGGGWRCWRKGSWHDWSRGTRTDKAAQTCILITKLLLISTWRCLVFSLSLQLSLFLTWDTFSSLDCGLIHMTALLLDHFTSYGSQDKALKCFVFVEWLMWLKKSSLLIGWLEKRRGAQGARAPLPLNRDRNSFHFDDLPTFERFLESQIEQPQAWSLYAAFYRLTIAPKLLGKGSREPSE